MSDCFWGIGFRLNIFAKNIIWVTVYIASASHREAVVSVQPDISDIKFDDLVKVVTAIFSIVKVSFSIVFESVSVLRLAKY